MPVGRSYIFFWWTKLDESERHNWDSFRKNPSWPLWSVDHHGLNKYKWSRRGVVIAFFRLFCSPCQQIPINCSSVPLVSVQCAEQLNHGASTRSYHVCHAHTDNSENIYIVNSQLNPVGLTRTLNISKHSGGNTLLDVTTVIILQHILLDRCYITLLLLAVSPNTGGVLWVTIQLQIKTFQLKTHSHGGAIEETSGIHRLGPRLCGPWKSVRNSLAIHPVEEVFQFGPNCWTNIAILRAETLAYNSRFPMMRVMHLISGAFIGLPRSPLRSLLSFLTFTS